MRVCTYADRFASVGGIERVQLDVCRRLADRGHEVTVLVKELGDLEEQWEAFARVEPVRGFTVRRERPLAGVRRVLATARRAASSHPDVLYVHRHAVVQSAWPATVLARGAGLVCHLHAMAPPHRGVVTRFLHRRVDRWIAVSEAVAASWRAAGIPAARLVTVPNGVDTEWFVPATDGERRAARATVGVDPDAFVVTFAGRLDPGKGVHVLAEAIRRLASVDPAVQLVVVGGDPEHPARDEDPTYLRDVAARAPATTRWFARQVDVRPFLAAADVAVVPSVFAEAHPVGVLEGLAVGLPVVAAAVGGVPEQLAGPLAELLVPPDDVAALAARLAALRHWRRDRPELGALARAEAETRFSTLRVVDHIEEVLVSASRPRSRRAR